MAAVNIEDGPPLPDSDEDRVSSHGEDHEVDPHRKEDEDPPLVEGEDTLVHEPGSHATGGRPNTPPAAEATGRRSGRIMFINNNAPRRAARGAGSAVIPTGVASDQGSPNRHRLCIPAIIESELLEGLDEVPANMRTFLIRQHRILDRLQKQNLQKWTATVEQQVVLRSELAEVEMRIHSNSQVHRIEQRVRVVMNALPAPPNASQASSTNWIAPPTPPEIQQPQGAANSDAFARILTATTSAP